MIFVSLGTQDKSFNRLLGKIEDGINKGYINDEVIVQAGATNFISKNMKIYNLISIKDFDNYLKRCDLLITHGGVGNILSGLKYNKKIIAMPRLKKYDEHENDHQIQIVSEYFKMGYILKLDEDDDLQKVMELAKTFKFKKYKSNNKNFIKLIDELINEL